MDFSQVFASLVEKLEGWVETTILLLPNFVAALLVLVLFLFLARFARKLAKGLMRRVSSYGNVNHLAATLTYVMVFGAGLLIALGILDLSETVTTILAGAGIVGLALGFAFQDIAANFISGILMSVRRPFEEGDIIETNDFTGICQEINLRSTILRTFQGQEVIIPNKEVFQNPVINYTKRRQRRVDLGCGVAYGDDLEKARTIALEAIRGLALRDQNRAVELYYEEFGDSSINFKLRFWIDFHKQTDFLDARSEAIMALKKAFDEHDITIPFPIRTLDFGVVGGEKLNEVLPQSFYESTDGARA